MAERDIWRRRDIDRPRAQYADEEWNRPGARRSVRLSSEYGRTAQLYGERGFGVTGGDFGPRYAGATGGSWMQDDTESWRRNQLYGDDGTRSFNDLWQDSYGPQAGARQANDAQRMSSFRGRGPAGYRRSDERIREDVCECLTDDAYLDATEIEVTVKDRIVTLSGLVNSRHEKRRAEELVDRIGGVEDVQNSLRVANERSGNERVTTSIDSGQGFRH
jgi:osmotically-inducible protein OsmY